MLRDDRRHLSDNCQFDSQFRKPARRDPSQLATTTPHGFVALVPGTTPHTDGPWQTLWTTDGDHLSRNGKSFTLSEARTALTADLAAGAKTLPFAVTGHVFHQVVEVAPRHYIIALVDSGWLDPADRDVKLTAQLPGNWQVTDRLTGNPMGSMSDGLVLTVPSGTLRLLEVRDATQSDRATIPSK